MNRTEQAIQEFFRSMPPLSGKGDVARLDRIRDALMQGDTWSKQSEWRISTWFDSRIVRAQANGRTWFKVSVECDGQTVSCRCPTVERAFRFLELYEHLIVYQFYSVGAPWMDVEEAAYRRP